LEAKDAGMAPQPSKLHSPLTLNVCRVVALSLGCLGSSLPPHAAKKIEPNKKLETPIIDFIGWTSGYTFAKTAPNRGDEC